MRQAQAIVAPTRRPSDEAAEIVRYRRILGYVAIIAFLAAWQLLWNAGIINVAIIPSPLEVLRSFQSSIVDGSLGENILASLQRVVVGYLIAAAVGIPLGIGLGRLPFLRDILLPTVELLRPIPPLAWVPLAIVWFGIGNGPSYFIVFLASVFPIFINALDGSLAIDKVYLRAAQCLGLGAWRTFRLVIWPAALPQILTGLRVGAGIAWMAVVGAEMIAARSGLGYMIYEGSVLLRTDHIVEYMIAVGILGAATALALAALQQRVLRWRQ